MDLQHYNREIDRAKLTIMSTPKTTFYSALLSMLQIHVTEEIPTAATNGLYIKYNPQFIDNITRPQLVGLTMHEVEHVVNDHVGICMSGSLDPDLHNIACDHYINLRLQAMGFELPPTPGLGGPPNTNGYADPRFKGMSSMEIYHILEKEDKRDKANGGSGLQLPGSLQDLIPDLDGMSPEEAQEKVLGNITKAVMIAEQANDPGSIPGELRRSLEDILSPKLPWQTILMQFLTEWCDEDYSMRRPNRRFMPDWYLPTIYGESLGHLVMGCDVSGSMSEEDISEIWSEYSYIFETMNPKSAHIMTFDTRVHLDKTYEKGDFIPEFELEGGGGTNVVPLLDAIREECPEFALIFTDGYFATPDMSEIETSIFWIIKGNPQFTAPMGEIIHFE